MSKTLGEVMREAREKKGWTLREAEVATGVHNAHLSQIETGAITHPSEALLWTLAGVYDLDYLKLLRLAGHTTRDAPRAGHQSLAGAALHALGDLTPEEQRDVLQYMDALRRRRSSTHEETS